MDKIVLQVRKHQRRNALPKQPVLPIDNGRAGIVTT